MMTAASIPASSAGGYGDYLHSRTVAPEQGDYYVGADGAPTEAAGRWLTSPDALARIGITRHPTVAPEDLRALMEGRRPDGDGWLRPAGPDGSRAGGLDLTFSAPKSVSVVWAVSGQAGREAIEGAHRQAVAAAVEYLRQRVALTVERVGGERLPARARELHAAEFLHTTARGVSGSLPDPQLHSHVVVTSLERQDGTIAAVRSRPAFRAAAEVGAFYRAQLATGMRALGYTTEQAGKERRYFRIRGVDDTLERAFSKRTDEVRHAWEDFRARTGRDPQRGELRTLAVRTRNPKLPRTRDELDSAWRGEAASHGLDRARLAGLRSTSTTQPDPDAWADHVEAAATRTRAVFEERELRRVALEQAPGAGLDTQAALAGLTALRDDGRVLELADGRLTTSRMRALERSLETRITRISRDHGRHVPADARERAITVVEERLGQPLAPEQRHAVGVLTGPDRVVALSGQAGTGKGVVLDAAARAEQASGREVVGVAVAGRTAQQLGEDSPALAGRVHTVDGYLNAVEHERAPLDAQTTVYLDEAGMGDTRRLARLTAAIDERGGSLVLVGDARQLPSVGAGGMFARLQERVPSAELREVHRTADPAERAAWQALRDGDPAQAMAHYRERGALQFADTRVEAVDHAAQRYLELTDTHRPSAVALMTDASNAEVDALNRRVQTLREQRGELDGTTVEIGEQGHQAHQGDRVVWTRPMPVTGEPRIENGIRGEVVAVDERHDALRVRLDGSGREINVAREDAGGLRLGYASHVYRAQGATVDRAVVVTGGWETSRESAYVEASRAREGVDWHVARDELEGDHDAARVEQLSERMRASRAQEPSIAHDLKPEPTPIAPEDFSRPQSRDLQPEPTPSGAAGLDR